jgi:competence protein ComEC
MHWMPFAMVRIAVFYIAGIGLAMIFPQQPDKDLCALLFVLFSVSYFPAYFLTRKSRNIKVISGCVGLMAITCAGFTQVRWQEETYLRGNSFEPQQVKAFVVELTVPPEEKSKSWKRAGVVTQIYSDSGWRAVASGINLFFEKSDSAELLDYGDRVLIPGAPLAIEPAYNPGEFDFRRHYANKHIFLQRRLDSGKWTLLSRSTDKGFLFYAQRMRKACVGAIKKYIPVGQEQGILMALVLGVTDGLDSEVLSAYAASGAMHVLAVSGMHVSILYGILLFAFKPIRKSPVSEWSIAVLCLWLLWMYAFITGLSPSVLRAVTMFSFVAVAKPMGRNTNIYNTLAASAFILLLYDPWLLLSVGFQLSYLAVFGIVYLQRPLNNLWAAPNVVLHWAWQITTVSIAAQWATVAISVYYFHQFPTYFLLANLVVIPASTVVLVGGIVLLVVSPLPVVATPLGIVLQWCTEKMDDALFLTERLPGSLWQPIHITGVGAVALFVLLLGLVLFFQHRRFGAFVILVMAAWALSGAAWWQWRQQQRSTWIVYRLPGRHATEWITGGQALLNADSVLWAQASRMKFSIDPAHIQEGVRTVRRLSLRDHQVHGLQFFRFGGKIFVWIASPDYQLPSRLPVDAILISHNAVRSLYPLSQRVDSALVVLDATNFRSRTARLAGEATPRMPVYAVRESGALVIRW